VLTANYYNTHREKSLQEDPTDFFPFLCPRMSPHFLLPLRSPSGRPACRSFTVSPRLVRDPLAVCLPSLRGPSATRSQIAREPSAIRSSAVHARSACGLSAIRPRVHPLPVRKSPANRLRSARPRSMRDPLAICLPSVRSPSATRPQIAREPSAIRSSAVHPLPVRDPSAAHSCDLSPAHRSPYSASHALSASTWRRYTTRDNMMLSSYSNIIGANTISAEIRSGGVTRAETMSSSKMA